MCTLLLLFNIIVVLAQQKTVSGVVYDENNEPLPFVNILVKNTSNGTQSDIEGKFSIECSENDILIISYVGYETKELPVANQTNLTVSLTPANELETVVVTAQGIKRSEKGLGYATQNVNEELIQAQPEPDVAKLLDGKLAGVDINSTGGVPGSGSSVIIRTIGNITGGNQPLWVVDGVPFLSGTDSPQNFTGAGGGTSSSRFLDLDPNNIQDIRVLKGLAATTLYGDQGKNGVILVTTKNAKLAEGAFNIDLTMNSYITQVANLPEFQNKYGQGGGNQINTGFVGTWGDIADGREVPHWLSGADFADVFPQFQGVTVPYRTYKNNVKDYFQTGFGKGINFRASGRNQDLSYNAGFNYTNEDGYIPNSGLTRYGFSFGGKTKIGDKLEVSGSGSYTKTGTHSPPISASNGGGVSVFTRLLFIPRSLDLHGIPYQNPVDGSNVFYSRTDVDNPLWLTANSRNTENIDRFNGKMELNYAFNPKFNLKYRFGLDTYTNKLGFHINRGSAVANLNLGILRDDIRTNRLFSHDVILSTKLFKVNDFGVDGLVGFNMRRDELETLSLVSQGQVIFGRVNHDNFTTQSAGQGYFERNVFGAYAQANLSFKNYLYLNLSARKDWISNLEKEHNSAFYPSASLSFILTDAVPALKESKAFNYLKLRGSYATAADFPGLSYLTRQTADLETQDFDGLTTISSATTLGNFDLQPILHKEYELGLETRLINNRVKLEATYFHRDTEDQILQRSLDPASGYLSTNINAGLVSSDGLEVSLDLTPIQTDNFTWNVMSNFYAYETIVEELPEGSEFFAVNGFNGLGNYAVEGEPINVIVGTYALKDANGNYLINPDDGHIIKSDDVGLNDKVIGDPNPDWTLNVFNTFRYKNLSLTAQVDYVHGGDVYSQTIQNLLRRGVTKDTETGRDQTFVIPGVYANPDTGEILTDNAGNPIPNQVQVAANDLYFLNLLDASSESIYDGSRVRLKNVSIAYDFPKQWLKNTGISSLKFTLTGENLWYKAFNIPEYTNVDFDVNSVGVGTGQGLDFQTALNSKRYGAALKLTF